MRAAASIRLLYCRVVSTANTLACMAYRNAPWPWVGTAKSSAGLAPEHVSSSSFRSTGADNMSDPIRILIVDDHAVVRKGLAMVLRLEPDLEVVGEAANGQAGLAAAESLNPDIALVDL